MSDMLSAITPKSDQLNADDLPAGTSKTIRITRVTIKSGDQPISIFYEGDNGKPYKPCKSMARVMVHCWGADANQYAGRCMTLYCEPSVKWGGMEVGGIRISHLSHIETKIVMALTVTRGKKAPFIVEPIPEHQHTPQQTSRAKPPKDPDADEPATDDQLEELGYAFATHTWSNQKQDELLLKVSDLRVAKKLPPATKFRDLTRGQIRWAISQVR